VHFDETGFRIAGRLAWARSASSGKFVLVTVHPKRGKDGMTAAGILPFFRGIAVHDAWKPYDSFDNVAGHALCGAHLLRELVAVTETGTDLDRTWARQAVDALLALEQAAEAARAAGPAAMDPEMLAEHEDWYRKAAATGIALNAGRKGKLQQKRHALAIRMQAREDDYLRFARDLRVPFSNNEAERTIRMSKLPIKTSGSMRSMTGAEESQAARVWMTAGSMAGLASQSKARSDFSRGEPGSLDLALRAAAGVVVALGHEHLGEEAAVGHLLAGGGVGEVGELGADGGQAQHPAGVLLVRSRIQLSRVLPSRSCRAGSRRVIRRTRTGNATGIATA